MIQNCSKNRVRKSECQRESFRNARGSVRPASTDGPAVENDFILESLPSSLLARSRSRESSRAWLFSQRGVVPVQHTAGSGPNSDSIAYRGV